MSEKDLSKIKMMTDCDIVLMIPGRRDRTDGKALAPLPVRDSAQTQFFIDAMVKNVSIEMSEAAQQEIARYNLGTAALRFDHDEDMPRKDDIVKEGVSCMLALHKSTKLCVLEIYIPNSDDGVQMLECYGNDEVYIKPEGRSEFIPEAEYLKELDINVTGLKRSAVFAYGNPSEQECVHCLANELTPHDGSVEGVLLEKVRHQNRSQYSGSRTYASATTLLEVSTEAEKPSDDKRIDYQTSEIYFVEQILLRDASATDINHRLMELSRKAGREKIKSDEIKKELKKIDSAFSQSTVLYDVSMFKWATIQEEIRLLSEDLGVPVITERNRSSKAILESLQKAVEAEENEKSEKLKNGFLLAITGMSLIDTLYTGLSNFGSKNFLYDLSLFIVLCAFLIYSFIKKKKF